jgi:ABC-2 type transport system ATP-binding protein
MTTQPNQAIRVRGLEKSYKKLEVLRGVEFDVAPGSIFALLGSNGAGKTTVVRILSTLLKADAGTASVNGFDVATHPAAVPSPRPAGDRGGARWTAAVAG